MTQSAIVTEPAYSRRDANWILANIDVLAHMHTEMMHEAWGETWSNDPLGTDTRMNSYALWRQYVDQGAVFFSADIDGRIAGIGVLIRLCEADMGLEWAALIRQAGGTFAHHPKPGDFEFAMVLVDPDWRKNGVFRELAFRRLSYAWAAADIGDSMWVQTLADADNTASIRKFYQGRGFEPAGFLEIKGTRRVFLHTLKTAE